MLKSIAYAVLTTCATPGAISELARLRLLRIAGGCRMLNGSGCRARNAKQKREDVAFAVGDHEKSVDLSLERAAF